MESSKIYKLLILIFLVLTVLFYSLYMKETNLKSYLSDEFVNGAVANLHASGVNISSEIIDKTIPEKDIYVFDIDNVDAHRNALTDAINKTMFLGKATTTGFETPDGVSVGFYDSSNKAGEFGRVVFSNNNLLFDFSVSGATVNGSGDAIVNGVIDGITSAQTEAVKRFMSALPHSKLDWHISGSSVGDEYVIISVVQVIDGYDIHDSYINFVFDKDSIISISGRLITKEPIAKYNNRLIDGVNVLYKLKLNNISTVVSEKLVYFLRKSGTSKYFVVPGWKIEYLDKQGKIIVEYFDAV